MEIEGLRIHITGIVQGVGFRPFVFSLAKRLSLTGWVRNTSAGVDIEVDGASNHLEQFVQALHNEAPPLARIDEFKVERRPADNFTDFKIIHSEAIVHAFQPVSPDVSICSDCLRELFDPNDRRYRYPFINCTNCGPRFTIIQDIPYDRPNTTMSGFPMCPDCAREYSDPTNRRFHAQPVACPVCGPRVWLEESNYPFVSAEIHDPLSHQDDQAIAQAIELLAQGKIVAIKGLGGFHLACDAFNDDAVNTLRARKLRVDKPFALMMPDVETVEKHCFLNEAERQLLESRQRPIVILRRKPESNISPAVAPKQDTLGVMLPYTPLHYLLFSPSPRPISDQQRTCQVLVMTSGNLSEEPIATDNDEARLRLGKLADAFLMHNRPIQTRCDDSVVRFFSVPEAILTDHPIKINPQKKGHNPDNLLPLRRSRGYAPDPILLRWNSPQILATGAELKNTFCLVRDQYAFLSHYIGDMENYETFLAFENGIQHFEQLFKVNPDIIACDLHPDYLATRYAKERVERENLKLVNIQHHHAHIAACMADNRLSNEETVIGVAFDGTGYGTDGAIWGGEFLIANYRGFQRAAHLQYMPLPGGDAAIRKPARIALAYLWQSELPWFPELAPSQALCAEERTALRAQLEHRINTPLTSSVGRLFDAVAALAGIRQQVNYEAQAAIELEALVDRPEDKSYPFEIISPSSGEKPLSENNAPLEISLAPLLGALLQDMSNEVPPSIIAARFHNAMAEVILDVCNIIRSETSISRVALSGGVWQNLTLLESTCRLLVDHGYQIFVHHQVPPNDGGISLGQAAIAAHYIG